jgi:hypothetical protein
MFQGLKYMVNKAHEDKVRWQRGLSQTIILLSLTIIIHASLPRCSSVLARARQ